jgi:hypothetical protein
MTRSKKKQILTQEAGLQVQWCTMTRSNRRCKKRTLEFDRRGTRIRRAETPSKHCRSESAIKITVAQSISGVKNGQSMAEPVQPARELLLQNTTGQTPSSA